MSHLKESMVMSFTANTPVINKYELIFPIVTPFTFTVNLVGSVGYLNGGAPTAQATYDLVEEISTTSVGSINIAASTGIVTFVLAASYSFEPGDVLTARCTNLQGMTGALGVSLVGER